MLCHGRGYLESWMALFFQSLRSSSSGNCLKLWSATGGILIDCGMKTQHEFDDELDGHAGKFDAAIVSHAHSDHIGYPALKVLGRRGVKIFTHGDVVRHIKRRFDFNLWEPSPEIGLFGPGPIRVSDFEIEPFQVPHAPDTPNFGFVIHHTDGAVRRKIVICTDFYRGDDVIDRFVDADFIFVESNHDPELLKRNPNYASHFHMSNGKTGKLLHEAWQKSITKPRTVMLGHLSAKRNTERLAIDTVRESFAGHPAKFDLCAAPKYRASPIIEL
jgi:ribonuclease BN (tRNA processing enzyme)